MTSPQRPRDDASGVLLVILLVSAAVTIVALWVWASDQRRHQDDVTLRAPVESLPEWAPPAAAGDRR